MKPKTLKQEEMKNLRFYLKELTELTEQVAVLIELASLALEDKDEEDK